MGQFYFGVQAGRWVRITSALTLRNELLDQHLFVRLEDVREAAYWWLLEYNEERPHDSLGDLTPSEYAQVARNSSYELSP